MRVSSGLMIGIMGATALLAALYMPSISDARPSGDAGKDQVNPYWSSAIWKNWKDGKGQSRSPCPMLNTLANHGLLNYDGRNIDATSLKNALSNYLGVRGILLNGLMKGHTDLSAAHAKKFGGDGTTFDLEDAGIHGIIEHDASLTRERYIASDPQRVLPINVAKVHELLQYAENGVLTYKSLTRFRDLVDSREKKDGLQPPTNFDFRSHALAYGEASILLEIVGRNGQLRVEDAEEFLIHERFPKNYKALPPSSLSDAYIISRVINEFGLEVAVQFFGLGSTQNAQRIAASAPSQ